MHADKVLKTMEKGQKLGLKLSLSMSLVPQKPRRPGTRVWPTKFQRLAPPPGDHYHEPPLDGYWATVPPRTKTVDTNS
ncbi:MAG: hypothetical protein AAB573_00315 [Patescibacteria group bacterium]